MLIICCLIVFYMVLNGVCCTQTPPNLGGGLDSTVRYTVVITGAHDISMNYTDVQCDSNNQCFLMATLPGMLTANSINVSVVASNILGTGPPANYKGKSIWLHTHKEEITLSSFPYRMQSRRSWY